MEYSYGFYKQCVNLYEDESVWNDFMSAFDCLPLCAIINDTIFAAHAGISPFLHRISDIDDLDRFQEIPLISIAPLIFCCFISLTIRRIIL